MAGRREYLSVNALSFKTQSRKDDLYSLMYALITLRSRVRLSDSMKMDQTLAGLCEKNELAEFEDIANEIETLEYDDKPNYGKLKFLFCKVILNMERLPCEQNYDWNR